jgi:DNA-binding NtrC family response regulator
MKEKRIVVVDDVQITLLAIEQKIGSQNRKIELCTNFDDAESAIDKLGGADFLIIDMRIDGNTISNVEIERFKHRCPNVHIAIITGDLNVTEQQVKDLGADRLFSKPIEWHAGVMKMVDIEA